MKRGAGHHRAGRAVDALRRRHRPDHPERLAQARVAHRASAKGLFSEWREGSDFVLNQARYDGASILVAGPNFGTGSSREHAVWALQDYGFEAVVSPRFGDIFRNNSLKMGLVPVTLPHAIVERLQVALDEDPAIELVVDVEARRFAVPALGIDEPFELDDFTQHRLLEGLDDVGITLTHDSEIASYETHRPAWMPSRPRR